MRGPGPRRMFWAGVAMTAVIGGYRMLDSDPTTPAPAPAAECTLDGGVGLPPVDGAYSHLQAEDVLEMPESKPLSQDIGITAIALAESQAGQLLSTPEAPKLVDAQAMEFRIPDEPVDLTKSVKELATALKNNVAAGYPAPLLVVNAPAPAVDSAKESPDGLLKDLSTPETDILDATFAEFENAGITPEMLGTVAFRMNDILKRGAAAETLVEATNKLTTAACKASPKTGVAILIDVHDPNLDIVTAALPQLDLAPVSTIVIESNIDPDKVSVSTRRNQVVANLGDQLNTNKLEQLMETIDPGSTLNPPFVIKTTMSMYTREGATSPAKITAIERAIMATIHELRDGADRPGRDIAGLIVDIARHSKNDDRGLSPASTRVLDDFAKRTAEEGMSFSVMAAPPIS